MTNSVLEPHSFVDERVTRWARGLAQRTPRRSFLGKAGRGLVASSAGGTAALALFAESAYASYCGGWDNSVTCECLVGNNSCLSDTCACGSWATCSTHCGHCTTYWTDCCDVTYHGCACTSYCSNAPRSCFTKEWSGGCGDSSYHIRCRVYSCDCSGAQGC